jgi:uncharacterized protein YaiI (UPF0178 family)
MRVLVDADACPVKGIVAGIARRRGVDVVMFIDTSHELGCEYGRVVTVSRQPDGADYALIGAAERGDVVVTQDYGLAAMALAKGAAAINQNGLVYTEANIDSLLQSRFAGQKIRRAGGRTKGPPKRTRDDDRRFAEAFENLLDAASSAADKK